MKATTQALIRNQIWAYLEEAKDDHLVTIRRVVNSILDERMWNRIKEESVRKMEEEEWIVNVGNWSIGVNVLLQIVRRKKNENN